MNKVTTLATAMEQMANAVTSTNHTVTALATQIRGVSDKLDAMDTRLTNLEDNAEITTEQRKAIKRAVKRKVYDLLKLPMKRQDWSEKHKIDSHKYGSLFFSHCYSEVSSLGHLASPYGLTTKANYADAIKDIGEWTPLGGVSALKKEAEENIRIRKIIYEKD